MGTLFTLMFVLVPLFIAAVFVLMIGIFVVVAVKGIAQWTDNNAQPVLTFPVRIATQRLHVSGGGQDSSASTSYHITFETLAGGLCQEFRVSATDYSGLAEDDTGDLTHQGTRYKGFVRVRRPAAPPPIAAAPARRPGPAVTARRSSTARNTNARPAARQNARSPRPIDFHRKQIPHLPMLSFIGVPELVIIGLVVPLAVACFAFWVWMLLDCVRNPRLTDTERLIWAIVICLAHLLGALIYFFAGRRHSKTQTPSAIR